MGIEVLLFASTLFDIHIDIPPRPIFCAVFFVSHGCLLWLSGGLASLEKLQATLDSLAAEAPTNKAKKDSSMPALVAINKERTWTHVHTIMRAHHVRTHISI